MDEIIRQIEELRQQAGDLMEHFLETGDEWMHAHACDHYIKALELSQQEGLAEEYYRTWVDYIGTFHDNVEYQRTAYQSIINGVNGFSAEYIDICLLAFRRLAYTYPAPGHMLVQALCAVPALAPGQAGEYPRTFVLRAGIENEVARIYLDKDVRPIAELHFRQSLYLLQMAATYHSTLYMGDYMQAAETLGNRYLEWFEYRKAAPVFREMKAMAALVTDEDERNQYLKTAINGISDTGTAFCDSNMNSEALGLFLEAMDDFWQLSETLPVHLNDVAMLQNSIGNRYILDGEYGKASDILNKALNTYRYIREKGVGFAPDLEADVYLNIAVMQIHLKDFQPATETLRKACSMYRKVLKSAPTDSIWVRYGTALSNLGTINPSPRWPFRALWATYKALNIRRKLVRYYPGEMDLRGDLADCYFNLGNTFYRFIPALSPRMYKAAIRLREPLAEADPGRYLQPLANIYRNIAFVTGSSGFMAPKKLYTQRLEYCLQSLAAYVKLQQPGFKHEMASLSADAGECCMNLGMYDNARSHLMDAMMIYHGIEPELSIDEWSKWLGSMILFIVYLVYKKDKHNAAIILERFNQKISEAPETFSGNSKLMEKQRQLAEMVAKME